MPKVSGVHIQEKKKRKRGNFGYDAGWGSSARQKLYFGPLGYEAGSSPIQRKTSFERSYNYSLRYEVRKGLRISNHDYFMKGGW